MTEIVSSWFPGIQHIAPSGTPENAKIPRVDVSKPQVVFDASQDQQDLEWDLSDQEFQYQGAPKARGESQSQELPQDMGPESRRSLDHPDLEDPVDLWVRAGSGYAKADCGKTMVFGCLNVQEHVEENHRLDGSESHAGKVYVDLRRHSCMRLEYPVCYEKATAREAGRIEYRLKAWNSRGKPIHFMVSAPLPLYYLSIEKLRERAYKVARSVGFWGGSCIPHHLRKRCKICGTPKDGTEQRCLNCGCGELVWYYSPHFHMIGYGWIKGALVAKENERSGWVCKKVGATREEEGAVFQTAMYQLSHCSTKKGRHTVTWFGAMAYNKLKVKGQVLEKKLCPLCGSELEPLRWLGDGPLPWIEEGDHYGDLEDWGRRMLHPKPRWSSL